MKIGVLLIIELIKFTSHNFIIMNWAYHDWIMDFLLLFSKLNHTFWLEMYVHTIKLINDEHVINSKT